MDLLGKTYQRTDLPVLLLYNIDHLWSPEEISESIGITENLAQALQALGHPVTSACLEDAQLTSLLRQFNPDEVIVFNWCEEIPGIPRSCAQVAGELEALGFTFTGADQLALATNQDKDQVKRILRAGGIPTPDWQLCTSPVGIDWHRFPAIVKLAYEHCSLGIERESVVQSSADLAHRVQYVLDEYKQPALVEEFIDGREFHIGVVGNGQLQVLPPAEIDFSAFKDIHDRLCTYESNIDRNSLAYQLTIPKLPAELTQAEQGTLEEVVIAAYRALSCRDYARMDVRLRDGIFYMLDVNTNADISPDTSLIWAAEMRGRPYGQFGSLLVNLAAHRHPIFGAGF